MASEAQIAANRANARKSTGPRTAEGKARVARNGLKHGLCARDALLPEEDPAEFAALVEDLKARWRPADGTELALLLQYADATWRLSRIAAVEAGLLADGLPPQEEADPSSAVHPDSLRLGRAWLARAKEISRLSLHESRLSRLRERARKELEALQAARQSALDSQVRASPAKETGAGPRRRPGDGAADFAAPAQPLAAGSARPLPPGEGAAPELALDWRVRAWPEVVDGPQPWPGGAARPPVDSRRAA